MLQFFILPTRDLHGYRDAAAVLPPDAFAGTVNCRFVFAEAHSFETAVRHSSGSQITPDGIGTAFTEGPVVFIGTAAVAMSLNDQSQRGILFEVFGDFVQIGSFAVNEDIGVIGEVDHGHTQTVLGIDRDPAVGIGSGIGIFQIRRIAPVASGGIGIADGIKSA